VNLPAAFASLAKMASAAMGAPFFAATILSQDTPGALGDDGGFVPGDDPAERTCTVQIDAMDERMRPEGWTDKDVRFIILTDSLAGPIDSDARVEVATGPFAGTWSVSSLEMDPAGIGWVGKARRG